MGRCEPVQGTIGKGPDLWPWSLGLSSAFELTANAVTHLRTWRGPSRGPRRRGTGTKGPLSGCLPESSAPKQAL